MILRAVSSLASLTVLTLLFTGAGVVLALHHLSIPTEWEKIWSLSVQLFVACWVCLDRKDHRLSLPFEFEAFVFFALPFALPYYLYRSRGARRGILLSVFIFGLVLMPGLVASVLESVLESVLRLI